MHAAAKSAADQAEVLASDKATLVRHLAAAQARLTQAPSPVTIRCAPSPNLSRLRVQLHHSC